MVQFHQDMQFPWPGLALPWRRGQAMLPTDTGMRRQLLSWIKVYGENDRTLDQFLTELGLDDLAIDAVPAAGRPTPEYALTWVTESQEWVIEVGSSCRARFKSDQFGMKPWQPYEIGRRLGLYACLTSWGNGTETISLPEGSDGSVLCARIDEWLTPHPLVGLIHRSLVDAASPREMDLRGFSVNVASEACLEPCALMAWRLAWMDRLTEWSRPDKAFGPGEAFAGEAGDFRAAFEGAVASWPDLMTCAVGLTEFLCWFLFGGGLGFAAKWPMNQA